MACQHGLPKARAGHANRGIERSTRWSPASSFRPPGAAGAGYVGAAALFLPVVWASLPEPRAFLAHLKEKAGLPASYWSASFRALRFSTETFGAEIAELDDD